MMQSTKNRVVVLRSNNHIRAMVISPEGKTLTYCSSIALPEKDKSKLTHTGNVASAYHVGTVLGERIKKLKIENLAFDRAGLKYHGRVKAVAEGLRFVKVDI